MSFQVEIDKAIKEKKLYFIGDALPVDWYAGFKLWLAHAEAGDAKAQYNVGRCYNRGDGIDQDKDKALYWYLKAADQNDPRALFNLYLLHSNEKNKVFDNQKSEEYLSKAIDLNEPRALNEVEQRKKAAFFKEGESIKQQVQELLDSKNFDQAERLLDEAIVKGYKWATTALAGIKVQLSDLLIKSHTTSEYVQSNYVSGGNSVGGGTVYDIKFGYYFEAQNKTNFKTNIQISTVQRSGEGRYLHENGWQAHELQAQEKKNLYLNSGTKKIDIHKYYVIDIESPADERPRKFEESIIDNGVIRFLRVPIKDTVKFIDKTGCFVITTCFNDPYHPVVIDFKRFRDSHLVRNSAGIKFVEFYYKYGPIAARFIDEKEYIKIPLRKIFLFISKMLP